MVLARKKKLMFYEKQWQALFRWQVKSNRVLKRRGYQEEKEKKERKGKREDFESLDL